MSNIADNIHGRREIAHKILKHLNMEGKGTEEIENIIKISVITLMLTVQMTTRKHLETLTT